MLSKTDNYKNSTSALDLYAEIEDMTGVFDVAPCLYQYYIQTLSKHKWQSLLDIGCGSGLFLEQLSKEFPNRVVQGIDLSPQMVEKALKRGVKAKVTQLHKVTEKFDTVTAVFDMLNYISPKDLPYFLESVHKVLNKDGLFLCDINSKFGFEEVANGSFITEKDDRFLAIDSEYYNEIYKADFTLFKSNSECYNKFQDRIYQFLHTKKSIEKHKIFKVVSSTPVTLYLNRPDKYYLILKAID